MCKFCFNCANKEFITERWENGEVIDNYYSCKLDNTVITDSEIVINCDDWKEIKVKSIKYPLFKEYNKCPF